MVYFCYVWWWSLRADCGLTKQDTLPSFTTRTAKLTTVNEVVLNRRLDTRMTAFVVWLSYLFILVARGRHALDRVPADQGYGIFESARQGFQVDAFTVPYINLVSQSIPYVIAPLPIATHAVAASLLVHTIWAICALIIFGTFRLASSSLAPAYLAGLALVLVPYASESSLGNPGIVGFALLTTSVVISAMSLVIRRAPRASATFGLITGLTSPLGFLAVIPTAIRFLRHRVLSREEWFFVGAVLSSLAANLGVVGLTGATSGRTGKILLMWNGAGVFWWSGWVGPSLISLAVLLFFLIFRRKLHDLWEVAVGLALASVCIAVAAYSLGGIGDRYFIAPAALAALSLLTLSLAVPRTRSWTSARQVVVPTVSLLLLVPSAKWFSASWYLTGGPTWSSEVRRAESLCRSTSVSQVDLSISPSSTHTLSCSYLVSDD
jgi:hypothetical protein